MGVFSYKTTASSAEPTELRFAFMDNFWVAEVFLCIANLFKLSQMFRRRYSWWASLLLEKCPLEVPILCHLSLLHFFDIVPTLGANNSVIFHLIWDLKNSPGDFPGMKLFPKFQLFYQYLHPFPITYIPLEILRITEYNSSIWIVIWSEESIINFIYLFQRKPFYITNVNEGTEIYNIIKMTES